MVFHKTIQKHIDQVDQCVIIQVDEEQDPVDENKATKDESKYVVRSTANSNICLNCSNYIVSEFKKKFLETNVPEQMLPWIDAFFAKVSVIGVIKERELPSYRYQMEFTADKDKFPSAIFDFMKNEILMIANEI